LNHLLFLHHLHIAEVSDDLIHRVPRGVVFRDGLINVLLRGEDFLDFAPGMVTQGVNGEEVGRIDHGHRESVLDSKEGQHLIAARQLHRHRAQDGRIDGVGIDPHLGKVELHTQSVEELIFRQPAFFDENRADLFRRLPLDLECLLELLGRDELALQENLADLLTVIVHVDPNVPDECGVFRNLP